MVKRWPWRDVVLVVLISVLGFVASFVPNGIPIIGGPFLLGPVQLGGWRTSIFAYSVTKR